MFFLATENRRNFVCIWKNEGNSQWSQDLPANAQQCFVYTLTQPSGSVFNRHVYTRMSGCAVKIPPSQTQSTTVTSLYPSGSRDEQMDVPNQLENAFSILQERYFQENKSSPVCHFEVTVAKTLARILRLPPIPCSQQVFTHNPTVNSEQKSCNNFSYLFTLKNILELNKWTKFVENWGHSYWIPSEFNWERDPLKDPSIGMRGQQNKPAHT